MLNEKLSAKSKFNRNEIIPLVKHLTKVVEPYCDKFAVVGSYRRKKSQIGDLEILVAGVSLDNVEHIISRSNKLTIHKTLWKGVKKSAYVVSFENIENLQLEFYRCEKYAWPASLLTRTGNATFNITMRAQAKRRGWLLNEYGLFNGNGKRFDLRTEKSIMDKLEIKWHEPEERSI